MGRPKKKLTAAQKAAKKKRQQEYMTVFMNGKQKRVKRPVTIDGMDVDEYIRQNADPIWLHQNEMWEYMEPMEEGDCFLSEGHLADYHPAGPDAGDIFFDDSDLDDEDLPF